MRCCQCLGILIFQFHLAPGPAGCLASPGVARVHPDSWSRWVPPACAQRVRPLRAEACAACTLFQPRACSLAPGLELFTGRLSPSLPPHLLLAGTPAVDPYCLRVPSAA